MNKPKSIAAATILGLITAFLLLEVGFQVGHGVSVWLKGRAEKRVLETNVGKGGTLTVMCVGESMTACPRKLAYTTYLQKMLGEQNPNLEVKIINKGVAHSTSAVTLEELDFNTARVNPDIVVAMIGINDVQTLLTKDHIQSRIKPSFWNRFRSIYFIKYLLFELKRQKKQKPPPIPVKFEKQMEYYFKTGRLSYFWDVENRALLDRKMFRAAGDAFSKNFWAAKCALNDHKAAKAQKLLHKAIGQEPDHPETYALLAVANALGETSPDPQLQTLCAQYSKNESAFLYLWGLLHMHYSQFETAGKAFKQGTKLDGSESVRFKVLQAELNRLQGRHRKAIRQLQEILESHPDNEAALYTASIVLLDVNDGKQGLKYLERLYTLNPNYGYALYLQAMTYAYLYTEHPDDKTLLEKAEKVLSKIPIGGGKLQTDIYAKLGRDDKLARQNQNFRNNYRKIFEKLNVQGIKLIAMQYPLQNIENLKNIFTPEQQKHIAFVDNGPSFEKLLDTHKYSEVFVDDFAGDFGHCTALGAKTMAANAFKTIQKTRQQQLK